MISRTDPSGSGQGSCSSCRRQARGRRGSGRVWVGASACGLLAGLGLLAGAAFAAPYGIHEAGFRTPLHAWELEGIPAFSRQFDTGCSTCHVTPGKLNPQGEAFRLNGYRFPAEMPGQEEVDRVPLGADPWKELWPEAIWPGSIPGTVPLALHIANDVRVARRDSDGRLAATYAFPAKVQLLAGTSLGGSVAAFLDIGWDREEGLHLSEAKVKVQDLLPWLPDRAFDLWIGAQQPHLLTLGDASLDRAARGRFLWERGSLADWEVAHPGAGAALVSESRFHLGDARPAVEVSGLMGGRVHYGVGAAQPASPAGDGGSRVSDVYARLRYKLGGIGLDGRPAEDFTPGAWGGQLLDRGVTVEHFVYIGETPLQDGSPDRHRSFGSALRVIRGRADAGVGHVRGRNTRPWGLSGPGARWSSTFVRGEYMFYPWLLGSAKADLTRLRARASDPGGPESTSLARTRFLPGLVVLLRPNVRAVAEGELFLRDAPRPGDAGLRPHALWLRLDVAF